MPEILVGEKRIRILSLAGDAFDAYIFYVQTRNREFLKALPVYDMDENNQIQYTSGEIVCRMSKDLAGTELCLQVHTDIKKHLIDDHNITPVRLYETRGPHSIEKKELIEAYFVGLVTAAESKMSYIPERQPIKKLSEPEQRPKAISPGQGASTQGRSPLVVPAVPARTTLGVIPYVSTTPSADFMSNYSGVHTITLMRGYNVIKRVWEYIDVPTSALPAAGPSPMMLSTSLQPPAPLPPLDGGSMPRPTGFMPSGVSPYPTSTTQMPRPSEPSVTVTSLISDDDDDEESGDSSSDDSSSDSSSTDTKSDRGRKRKRKSTKHRSKKSKRDKSRRGSKKHHKREKSSKNRK